MVFTWVCGVVPPRPESRGNRASALGPIAGTKAVGGTASTGVIAELNGSTVSCITDWVGLKNMVTVALACLIIGVGGDNTGGGIRGDSPLKIKGAVRRNGLNTDMDIGPDGDNAKGLGGPNQIGGCAPANPTKKANRMVIIKKTRKPFIEHSILYEKTLLISFSKD